jgi:hypothetical protein
MENAERSAYPVPELLDQIGDQLDGIDVIGLTKREYFAAMAMQGLLANQKIDNGHSELLCMASIGYADELLKQLSK